MMERFEIHYPEAPQQLPKRAMIQRSLNQRAVSQPATSMHAPLSNQANNVESRTISSSSHGSSHRKAACDIAMRGNLLGGLPARVARRLPEV